MRECNRYLNRDIVGLIQAANAGVIEAQLELASLYYYGDGGFIEKNHEKSIYWYRRAAKQGSEIAQFLLGGFYELGMTSLKRDAKKAVYWYSIAARQLFPPSIYALGMCYLRGFGLHKDESKAARCLLLASEEGDADAQCELASCYANGIGLRPNENKALRWYFLAAKQGNHNAMYALAIRHLATKYKLSKKSEQWLYQAAYLGNARVIKLLKRMYKRSLKCISP